MMWIAKGGQKMLVDPGTLPYWESLGWQVDADANAVGDLTQQSAAYASLRREALRALPNPVNPVDPVMASGAPTITPKATAGGADQFTPNTFLNLTATLAAITVKGITARTDNLVGTDTLRNGINNTYTVAPYVAEFFHYGSKLQMQFISNGATFSGFRLWVDDKLASASISQWTFGGNQNAKALIDFGGVFAVRRLRFEINNVSGIQGMNIEQTATVWPVEPSRIKSVFFGDSYVAGTGATIETTAFARRCAARLGWDEVYQAGEGGTGYTNAGNTGIGADIYLNRVPFLPVDADHVVIYGSTNDQGSSAATVQTAAAAVFTAVAARCPNARIWVMGPCSPTGTPAGALTTVRDGVSAAAAAAGLTFIDPIAGGWITGSGHAGATTGTGNGDLFIASDGIHPSQAGHDYIGTRLAETIANSSALF